MPPKGACADRCSRQIDLVSSVDRIMRINTSWPTKIGPKETGPSFPQGQFNNERLVWACACVRASCAVRVTLQGAVRERHRHELPAMRAVLKRMNDRGNLHARRQGLGDPT